MAWQGGVNEILSLKDRRAFEVFLRLLAGRIGQLINYESISMVIADVLKQRLNVGLEPDMYFVRDYKGFEVDLLVENGRSVDLYEIKSSMSFQGSFAENVARLSKIIPDTRHRTVVYSGAAARSAGVDFVNYANVKAF